jgi:hypothetical protein
MLARTAVALGATLLGRTVISAAPAAQPSAATVRTFTRDVAPLLDNNDAGCHRAGQRPPMSLPAHSVDSRRRATTTGQPPR